MIKFIFAILIVLIFFAVGKYLINSKTSSEQWTLVELHEEGDLVSETIPIPSEFKNCDGSTPTRELSCRGRVENTRSTSSGATISVEGKGILPNVEMTTSQSNQLSQSSEAEYQIPWIIPEGTVDILEISYQYFYIVKDAQVKNKNGQVFDAKVKYYTGICLMDITVLQHNTCETNSTVSINESFQIPQVDFPFILNINSGQEFLIEGQQLVCTGDVVINGEEISKQSEASIVVIPPNRTMSITSSQQADCKINPEDVENELKELVDTLCQTDCTDITIKLPDENGDFFSMTYSAISTEASK